MTNQKFMPDATPQERLQVLQDTAVRVEETKMYKPLSALELDIKREKLTENLISLDVANEAFELVKEQHKAKVKPLSAENAILITEVRTQQELVEGVFYHLPDYDNNIMVTYDAEGSVMNERRLRPDEKRGQSRLFTPVKKTGTEG